MVFSLKHYDEKRTGSANYKLPMTAVTLAVASAAMWAQPWAVVPVLATEPNGKIC